MNGLTDGAPNVIFFTDNGHGLGHLTRLMAVARKAEGRFNPVFLTMSLGFPLLKEFGFRFEYFPSYTNLDLSRRRWDPLFMSRLSEVVESTEARAVVVDHISPPRSFGWLNDRIDDVEFIWSRRGLWKEGRNQEGIDRAGEFDLVVEPGDVASPLDVGLTAEYRRGLLSVPPVVLVEPGEMLPSHEARSALGIPSTGIAVLIQLTDSEPTALESMISRTRSVLADVIDGELHCLAPLHPLHKGSLSTVDGVLMKPIYPMARYLRAFDGVVSTAGYNSFHEVTVSGVPAVFIPRATSSVDDQERRARFAELCGRASWAASVDDLKFVKAIERMLHPDEPVAARETASRLGPMDGAATFARIVAERSSGALGRPSNSKLGSTTQPPGRNWQYTHVKGVADVVVVTAFDTSKEDLAAMFTSEGRLKGFPAGALPVVLSHDVWSDLLISLGVPFETVMTESEWLTVNVAMPYSTYVERRLEHAIRRYGASKTIELG